MYTVYMLAADAAVAAAVFGLEHLISYCNHTKRCSGPTSRRRHSRVERESLHSLQLDRGRDAARQRAAATRTRETDEARAERCVCDCLRCEQPYAPGAAAK